MTARLITMEGGEGCGKTTQLNRLFTWFEKIGIPCIKTREPGGSPGAEQIRALLVSGDKDAWSADAETLLFYAARLDHVQRVIRPALARGEHVLCDRFADSTFVYQGIGKGIATDYIASLHRLTLGDFAPDLTLILDIDPEEGLKRAHARSDKETRFESMGLDYHRAVRQGFLDIAARQPKRCIVINASHPIEQIAGDIQTIIRKRL